LRHLLSPHANSDVDHSARTMTHVAHPCWGQPFSRSVRPYDEFDSEFHLAIQFEPSSSPKTNGMSGCGIWRIRQAGTTSWGIDDVKLVGVFHRRVLFERDGGKIEHALCGTRIGYVLGMLKKFDPGLQAAFNLVFPVTAPTQPGRMVVE